MYRLRDLKNGLYQIHSSRHRPAYEGTPKSVFALAVQIGVQQDDLVYAVNFLNKNGHDYADFDDSGRFLNTKTGKPR